MLAAGPQGTAKSRLHPQRRCEEGGEVTLIKLVGYENEVMSSGRTWQGLPNLCFTTSTTAGGGIFNFTSPLWLWLCVQVHGELTSGDRISLLLNDQPNVSSDTAIPSEGPTNAAGPGSPHKVLGSGSEVFRVQNELKEIHPSVHPSIHPSIRQSICPSIRPSFH